MSRRWVASVRPETMAAHRIKWFARIKPCSEYPDGWVPKNRHMPVSGWPGWDVRCSCGWQSSTGGGVHADVDAQARQHRVDREWQADHGLGPDWLPLDGRAVR